MSSFAAFSTALFFIVFFVFLFLADFIVLPHLFGNCRKDGTGTEIEKETEIEIEIDRDRDREWAEVGQSISLVLQTY